jgi:hypothetical protein
METDPFSPEDRRLFEALVDVIHEELHVCFASGRFDQPDGVEVTSGLIADVVWHGFEVRPRQERATAQAHEDPPNG